MIATRGGRYEGPVSPPDDTHAQALVARCADPGYTPGAKDVPGLLALWQTVRKGPDGRDAAKAVTKALARGDGGVVRRLIEGFGEVSGEERALRLRILDRIARRLEIPRWSALVARALTDPEPRVVREAARAAGKLPDDAGARLETALLDVLDGAALPEQRAVVESLGRVGTGAAWARLAAFQSDDPDLARRVAESVRLLSRRAGRAVASSLLLDRDLPEPVLVELRCRPGAAEIVAEQAATHLRLGADIEHPESVTLRWSGDLQALYRVRSATELGLRFPLLPGREPAEQIAGSLDQPALVAALRAWTEGPIRFRLAFADGAHHRGLVERVGQLLVERRSPLTNDSRAVTWSVEVDLDGDRLRCLPRGVDPRFAQRVAEVPAASHPTVAALLAWVAKPGAGDVIWDPFCGSGQELVECARLRDGLHLFGSDLEDGALTAARANLDASAAAGVIAPASVTFARADARTHVPDPARAVDVVLTNPPFGHRVTVDGELSGILVTFVRHVAELLAPGGRMVWLTPDATLTGRVARRAGLQVIDRGVVDLGGIRATLQILRCSGRSLART